MSHKLTLEELIKEYKKADLDGKEQLKQLVIADDVFKYLSENIDLTP